MKISAYVPDTKVFETAAASKANTDNKVNNSGDSFMNALSGELDKLNAQQVQADNETIDFIKGDGTDVHQVMIDTEEAKLSLQLAVQVRNKLLDAYQELNKTQI